MLMYTLKKNYLISSSTNEGNMIYDGLTLSTDNEHLTFRGNSIATKAMEAYMKLVGERVSLS